MNNHSLFILSFIPPWSSGSITQVPSIPLHSHRRERATRFVRKFPVSSSVPCTAMSDVLHLCLAPFSPAASGLLRALEGPSNPSLRQCAAQFGILNVSKTYISTTYLNFFEGNDGNQYCATQGLWGFGIVWLRPEGLSGSFPHWLSPCPGPDKFWGLQLICQMEYDIHQLRCRNHVLAELCDLEFCRHRSGWQRFPIVLESII